MDGEARPAGVLPAAAALAQVRLRRSQAGALARARAWGDCGATETLHGVTGGKEEGRGF